MIQMRKLDLRGGLKPTTPKIPTRRSYLCAIGDPRVESALGVVLRSICVCAFVLCVCVCVLCVCLCMCMCACEYVHVCAGDGILPVYSSDYIFTSTHTDAQLLYISLFSPLLNLR